MTATLMHPNTSEDDQRSYGTHRRYVVFGAHVDSPGQSGYEAHGTSARAVDPTDSPQPRDEATPIPPPAGGFTSEDDQSGYDTQAAPVVFGTIFDTAGHSADETHTICACRVEPFAAGPEIQLLADVLDDMESVRIANENRLRTFTAPLEESGLGLDPDEPEAQRLAGIVAAIKAIEADATKVLEKAVKTHPLGPWIKATPGVGFKQAARLIAAIGDPYVNEATGQPRTVGQLWAYAGHGDPTRKRAKGMSQEDMFRLGSPDAKMRVHLICESIWKAGTRDGAPTNDLAAVGHARKAATVGRLHSVECRRCGPSGKPAQVGSPWSDAHRHADALRVLGKELLKRMWLEARRLHEQDETE